MSLDVKTPLADEEMVLIQYALNSSTSEGDVKKWKVEVVQVCLNVLLRMHQKFVHSVNKSHI